MSTAGYTYKSVLEKFPHPENFKVGIALATWNKPITDKLYQGALDYLYKMGFQKEQIVTYPVSGTFELPLASQWLANTEKADAVISIGCVIKGETPHFDFICQACAQGIMQVGLNTNKPIVFCVLTTLTEQQAIERAGGKLGNKGEEAAMTALEMLLLKN